ncbi:MAG TPA: hypothetical protein PL091_07980 [Actinomycetota bacterium]|nr:hypothetical protein [Actinomycetota bacterium]
MTEIVRAYPDTRHVADGQGGAWIEIPEVEVGELYARSTSLLICLLPFALPAADVYPIFFDRTLTRTDGSALGEGFAPTELSWPGEPEPRAVTQVSRRTRGDFALQTPLIKIEKVLEWVRTR